MIAFRQDGIKGAKEAKLINQEENPEKKEMLYRVFSGSQYYSTITSKKNGYFAEILEAIKSVDRVYFALPSDAENAYMDVPLSIGHKQTISQPTTVARMLGLAALESGMDVLEIGSGSGWNAALTAYLVYPGKVVSVERIKPLSELAKKNAKKLPFEVKKRMNLEFVFGSAINKGSRIWKKKHDRIIATAGANPWLAEKLKGLSKSNLKDRGLLVFPTESSIEVWQKKKGKFERIYSDIGYSFVPLIE